MPSELNPCRVCGRTRIIVTQVKYPLVSSEACSVRIRCAACGKAINTKVFNEQEAFAAWNAANPKSVNKVIHGDESCICITCEHDGKDYQGCEDMYCPVTECKDYKEAETHE